MDLSHLPEVESAEAVEQHLSDLEAEGNALQEQLQQGQMRLQQISTEMSYYQGALKAFQTAG